MIGTNEYKQKAKNLKELNQFGPSYLNIDSDKIAELVKKYAGTGEIKFNKKGEWDNKEIILDNDEVIGKAIDNRSGKSAYTIVFKIHYADNGVHIVPDYPSKKRNRNKK